MRPKFYVLAQFPYPSGALHMGHVRVYTIADVIARHHKLLGHRVINPMGWDAFGLPAENAARSRGIPAREWTETNISQMRMQLKQLELDIDWDREVVTCSPEYSEWTQWIFTQLHQRGLAYQKEAVVNWDPVDKTVLADEQIDRQGRSWRSGALAEKRSLKQWFLRITAYANELHDGLAGLEHWPRSVRDMQRNWIGWKTVDGQDTFKIRDWLISRQRHWGTPIPIYHCPACGPQAGEHRCARCGSAGGSRESDTMDTFMDSSWYYLRFLDPRNSSVLADPALIQEWMPVDVYVGGVEHAIMHLLYARFINRALADILPRGVLPQEPFKQLICQGMVEGKAYQCPDTGRYLQPHELVRSAASVAVLATGKPAVETWDKMSKSKYNGVDPTDAVAKYGADALRLYILFKAPPAVPLAWSEKEISGPVRWLERLEQLACSVKARHGELAASDDALLGAHAEAVRKVNRAYDVKHHNFNTGVAALMKLSNALEAGMGQCSSATVSMVMQDLLLMLFPMAPVISARLHRELFGSDVQERTWPAGPRSSSQAGSRGS